MEQLDQPDDSVRKLLGETNLGPPLTHQSSAQNQEKRNKKYPSVSSSLEEKDDDKKADEEEKTEWSKRAPKTIH